MAREEHFLRIAFLAGAVTDAGALLPVLFSRVADVVWGLRDESGSYRFALRYGASLMLGWTVLLIWAYRRPLERRAVAALTVLVICGLIVSEVVAVQSGVLQASRILPTWCLQAVLLALFAVAFWQSRARRSVATHRA